MTASDRFDDLVAAYALDAVDADERRAFATVLAGDPDLQRELADVQAVAAILAEAVEGAPSTPSPRVWEGISGSIAGERDNAPRDLEAIAGLRRQRRLFRLVAAVSVTAIVVSAVLSVTIARMAATDDDPTQAAITALLEAPDSRVVTLTAPDGAATDAKIVLGASGVGYLFADSLPAISADRTYQLWAIVGEEVISAGVLGNDPFQSPFQVVGNVTGFAITDEVSGGVPVSEGSLVAVWSKSA